jgi:uncharacterized Ntn-hydrolase superfamily protein
MTISLAGRCARTGAVGGIISSSSPAVASRCLWVAAQGVVLTQNVTDPVLGVLGLKLLEDGYGAPGAMSQLVTARANSEWRQLAVLDGGGHSASFTGAKGLGVTAALRGHDCVAAGNLLANVDVVTAMVRAFEAAPQDFIADRLLAALEAGLGAGGEAGPVHSAGLAVHEHDVWPCVDLRVDWSEASPLADLQALWRRYQPQMKDYVNRARDPEQAPSFGVPGDL